MDVWFTKSDTPDDPDQRRDYTRYLARQMAPVIRALMLVGTASYLAATWASAVLAESSVPLLLRLAPAVGMLLAAAVTNRARRSLNLSLLTLFCVALIETGINVNGVGRAHGLSWVMPGALLVPIASAVIWPARWDFIAAMALCALGPLPLLFFGDASGAEIYQYMVYMIIVICLSTVLRAFMAHNLYEQFRLGQQLREQARTDGLTGLLLRNRFFELARIALNDATAQARPVCVLYLDVDHFKRLNDDCGHAAGDAALAALAACMRAQTRETDLIGRIGGEEFALLLPGLDLPQAVMRAEQLRRAVHAIPRPDGNLTVSIGLAQGKPTGEGIEALLARADKALARAKSAGRNRVVATSP